MGPIWPQTSHWRSPCYYDRVLPGSGGGTPAAGRVNLGMGLPFKEGPRQISLAANSRVLVKELASWRSGATVHPIENNKRTAPSSLNLHPSSLK